MLKIENSVPLPPNHTLPGLGRPPLYPFASLKFGESILIPAAEARKAIDEARKWRQRHPGWTYYHQAEPAGVRLWRTK